MDTIGAVVETERERSGRSSRERPGGGGVPAVAKRAIVDAALREFAQHGYGQTTLDAVARSVGLTRQGLLHHFPSKRRLFAEVIRSLCCWAADAVPGRAGAGLGVLDGFGPLRRGAGTASHVRLAHVLEAEGLVGDPDALEFSRARLRQERRQVRQHLRRAETAGFAGRDPDAVATLVVAALEGLEAQGLIDPDLDPRPAWQLLGALLQVPRRTVARPAAERAT